MAARSQCPIPAICTPTVRHLPSLSTMQRKTCWSALVGPRATLATATAHRGHEGDFRSHGHCSQQRKQTICLLPAPPGDSPTRGAFFDFLLWGCIPVVFLPNITYGFAEISDYYSIVEYSPQERVSAGSSVIEHLQKVDKAEIHRRQQTIDSLRPILQYSCPS